MLMDRTLENNWVLERTDIGQSEIATRALKLPMTARAVLIMVDGKSEVSHLQRKMAGLADGMSILESLLNNGLIRRRHYSSTTADSPGDELEKSAKFVEQALKQVAQASAKVVSIARPTAATPTTSAPKQAQAVTSSPAQSAPPAVTSKPVNTQRRSLGLARMYLLDQMERMFGDRSEAARNFLRTATTREELITIFADCREILIETAGEERALRIEMEFLAMLPETIA